MSRCSQCLNSHRQVGPSGPTDARIMLVGEGPGFNEDKIGIPFVGRAGQELDDTYLRLAGLNRSDIYVTNAVQCRQERNGVDIRPSAALTKCCVENHLKEEICSVNPEIVILCGATACSLVGIDLELQHGFPLLSSLSSQFTLYGWQGNFIPMYHPAAGLHESRFMIPMLQDWENLGRYLRSKWEPPQFIVETPNYRLLDTPSQVEYAISLKTYEYVAIDTETDEGKPWSIQFSVAPGHARMITAERKDLLKDFDVWLQFECQGKVVLHNALYDLDVLDRLGITVNSYRDTMQELYHLGNMPQGLKAATYRTSGHKMTSYSEVVTPYSKRALEDWLARSLDYIQTITPTYLHPVGPDCPSCGKRHRKESTSYVPHEAEAVLRRAMRNVGMESEYDPWLAPKWSKGEESMRLFGRPWLPMLEANIGRMPRPSIVHAPLEDAVQYGCSDADHTGRLASWLEHERERIVQEEWCVV